MILTNNCRAHNIVPLCLPPYTTHYLQPLDVGMFSPLEEAYKKKLKAQNGVGEVQIDKVDFWNFLKKTQEETFQESNIMSAWSATGK